MIPARRRRGRNRRTGFPREGENARGDTERDHIGQRVTSGEIAHVCVRRAIRPSRPCETRHDDHHRGGLEMRRGSQMARGGVRCALVGLERARTRKRLPAVTGSARRRPRAGGAGRASADRQALGQFNRRNRIVFIGPYAAQLHSNGALTRSPADRDLPFGPSRNSIREPNLITRFVHRSSPYPPVSCNRQCAAR